MKWSDKDKREWHRWFAWYPVRLISPDTGAHVTFWLQSVWRVRVDGTYFSYWIYNGYTANPKDR